MTEFAAAHGRPLRDRARSHLSAQARQQALRNATAEELRELGRRFALADSLQENSDQYCRHLAQLPDLKPSHANGLASIRGQAEDALGDVGQWFRERSFEPTEAEVDAFVDRVLADRPFDAPEDLPEADAPCDGLAVPAGYRWLGDTRGRKLPDGGRGTPHAMFLREADLSVWVRSRVPKRLGQLEGYVGVPVREVLGTRPRTSG